MRTIHVVAHPEATHHVENLVGGWHDSELTLAGHKAAVAIAQALRSKLPENATVDLFSSDLKRTAQTADQISAMLDAQPVLDRRLREKSYGEGEGRPQSWLDSRFVPPPHTGDRLNHDEGVVGAEPNRVFAHRVYAAMDDILASPTEHQVIVTHGYALTFVVASWIKMPLESLGYINLRAPSGSITTLREDDFFHNRQVVSLGDTSHLT